jgi:hypothetical protein
MLISTGASVAGTDTISSRGRAIGSPRHQPMAAPAADSSRTIADAAVASP